MEHHHEHQEAKQQLILGLILNGSFTIIELVGGLLSNSLALISDAMHDFTDTIALSLSLYANKKSVQKPSKTKTFGYKRATIIAALFNAIVLIALTFFITGLITRNPALLTLALQRTIQSVQMSLQLWFGQPRQSRTS